MDILKIEDYEKLLSEKGIKFEKTSDGRLLAEMHNRDCEGHTYQKMRIYKQGSKIVSEFLDIGATWVYYEDPTETISKYNTNRFTFFSGN